MCTAISRYLSAVLLIVAVAMLPAQLMAEANWSEIDQLQEQGKFADIPAKLDVIIQQSQRQGMNKDWRDALLYQVNISSLEDAAGALEKFIAAPWPKDQDSRLLLNLHLGAYIHQYIQRNSWQINQRETIDTDTPLAITQKTITQLREDAHTAFSKAYRLSLQRNDPMSQLNTLPLKQLSAYFSESDYPKNVRGTVRDTVTYLWIDALQNTSVWPAKQSAEVYSFNVQSLLSSPYKEAIDPTDPSVHPLKVAVKLASDLEQFHRKNQQPEAVLEAFRVKAETIAGIRSSQRDLQFVIQALRLKIRQQQNSGQALAWVNKLRLDLVSYLDHTDAANKQIQRFTEIRPCLSSDKEHRLYKLCQGVVDDIKHPMITLTTMKSDGVGKRSLALDYKNTEKVYFRAWKLAPQQVSEGINSQGEYVASALKRGDMGQHQWSVDLARTKDYQSHKHFLTPPMSQKGYWLIAASLEESFQDESARVWAGMNITNLVADLQNGENDLTVTTYLGESGQIAANVDVELWQQDYNPAVKPKRIATAKSGSDGRVYFKRKSDQRYAVALKYRDDYSFTSSLYSNHYYSTYKQTVKSALIFTDRAIYRPSQKVLWKVVAYHGNGEKGKYQVFPNSDGWVKLVDANGKLVKQIPVKTNGFGSASGEFEVDAGRLLGNWRILTSWGGGQAVRVEEYKRPTFEAKLLQPKQGVRLNHLAKVTGTARYYFGDMVRDGQAKWRVVRLPMSRGGRYVQDETVASGESETNAKGEFFISFKPTAMQLETNSDLPLVYRYKVSVDVTDSGGETRSASRTFSVAAVNVSASIKPDKRFGIAGQKMQFTVQRQDLDGEGVRGTGFWELYRLQQPKQAVMSADLPVRDLKKEQLTYATAGDKTRARWLPDVNLGQRAKYWGLGQRVSQGSLRHDAEGLADIKLTAPAPGVYRLRYTTKDQWGQVFQKQELVVVSNHQQAPVNVPALLLVEKLSVEVGENVSLLAGSSFAKSPALLEVFHGNKLLRRSVLRGGIKKQNFPVTQDYRGGLTFVLTMVKDYQLVRRQHNVDVLWTDRNLNVSFSTFRDKLRPGQKETWRVTVKDHKNRSMEVGAVEVLASMFDRSLQLFGKHQVPSVANLYPQKYPRLGLLSSLGRGASGTSLASPLREYIKPYESSRMQLVSGGRGYFGHRAGESLLMPTARRMAAPSAAAAVSDYTEISSLGSSGSEEEGGDTAAITDLDGVSTRKNFNETAFFKPHLLLEKNGSVTFEFEVPESLTQWKVWVSALTRDLRGGSATAFTRTSKELMVRPYLPRFLRAGDEANIEVLVNNSSDKAMSGHMSFDVIDPETEESMAADFKLNPQPRNFTVAAGNSTRQRYSIIAPKDLGMVAIRAKASAANGSQAYSDGEQRPLPVLPSRIHLSQSRFAALQGYSQRQLQFNELARNNDPTRINDKMVVTVDGQLLYSAIKAVPYLTDYPYECTEQTLNRFLSTSIINSTFAQTPSLKAMASEFAKRKTRLENWASIESDPNSKMLLEETPWLNQANGGRDDDTQLLKVLDPKVSAAQQRQALLKLSKAQLSSGGFPWWEGGPASPYMTAYLLQGFSKAAEFNVAVSKSMVQGAWRYLHQHYIKELKPKLDEPHHAVMLTVLNYTLSSFPDDSWYSGTFSQTERMQMLDNSMKEWQTLPALLKAQLALTLRRMGRSQQAVMVFESVMNSAKSDPDNGVYWVRQNRSWLWYNDRIDSHAFMLRAMMEISPQDTRRHGLVQWLMLNKKLNHWKSTRATAESVYALVHYMKREQQLGVDERMVVNLGNLPAQEFLFKVNEYSGGKQQMVIKDQDITPDMANITLKNESKPLMFASATWHFSTDKAPASAQGDFFTVERRFFKRVQQGAEWKLQPLAEGATIAVGDQLEVQLSLGSKHNAEFVHLRAPRGAGFEPMESNSGYRWQNGIGYYQEIRDSGMNYFFDRMPTGQYAFKYRLRATTSGKFRVAPATVQSVYAPEFNAYSRGTGLSIQ